MPGYSNPLKPLINKIYNFFKKDIRWVRLGVVKGSKDG